MYSTKNAFIDDLRKFAAAELLEAGENGGNAIFFRAYLIHAVLSHRQRDLTINVASLGKGHYPQLMSFDPIGAIGWFPVGGFTTMRNGGVDS